ncbi:hypothetical protein ACFVKB_33605 [Rhodococcus sp. NPDC127530]|uniref:hypothetical protein n=1 Tax=unclassified Rhodococcus (in: high G+C Gram-positive bacteria) TaxID=192944 RepID=UPI00363597E5
MPNFDPRNVCVSPNELLEKTSDPRHIAMIKNYRLHAMLEVSGRWKEILQDNMIVENPHYFMFYMDQALTLNGRDEVATFYSALDGSGGTVFGPLSEKMAVADWGLAIESHFAHHLRGYQIEAMGLTVENSKGYYQLEHWLSTFWPYSEDCLLIGERVYENPASRTIREVDPADFVTPDIAAQLLQPLIDEYQI